MRRIAILDDYQGVALDMADWARLPSDADITVFRDHIADRDALATRLAPFEVIVAMRERTVLDAPLLARLPHLRLITTMGRRNAAIDLRAAARAGVIVAGTAGGGSSPLGMAGFTWALILAITRGLTAEARSVRNGGWMTGVGTSLEGRTLGVIGFGRIGRKVADLGRSFGMEIAASGRSLTAQDAAASGVRLATPDEILERADVVTLHLVLSDETRGLVDAAALARMKPGAFLVNTSRGPLVDEAALIAALEAGRIAGAALDTFDVEPLPPDHPFRRMETVLATPHIGFVTDTALRAGYRTMLDAVDAYLAGRPVPLPLMA